MLNWNLSRSTLKSKKNINVILILGPELKIWTHLLPKSKLERKRSRLLFVSAWVQIFSFGPRIKITYNIPITLWRHMISKRTDSGRSFSIPSASVCPLAILTPASLQWNLCSLSQAEYLPSAKFFSIKIEKNNGSSKTRTWDLRIRRQTRYQCATSLAEV